MASLADLARSRFDGGDNQAIGDVFTYRQYVIACSEVGKTPLSQPEWIKAGKPSA